MPTAVPGLVRWSDSTVACVAPSELLVPVVTLARPKSRILAWPALGHKDIGGLDIAVNDILGVRGVERVSDLDGQREQAIEFERMAGDHMLQRRAIQKLHGDEGLAVLFANVVDGADVGMVQCRSGLRLPPKPLQCLMVAGHVFREKLEGHEAVEAGVLGFVNHTHAPAAELLDDAIVRDGLADHYLSDHVGPTDGIGDRGIGK